jgi:hypothetical protein
MEDVKAKERGKAPQFIIQYTLKDFSNATLVLFSVFGVFEEWLLMKLRV